MLFVLILGVYIAFFHSFESRKEIRSLSLISEGIHRSMIEKEYGKPDRIDEDSVYYYISEEWYYYSNYIKYLGNDGIKHFESGRSFKYENDLVIDLASFATASGVSNF